MSKADLQKLVLQGQERYSGACAEIKKLESALKGIIACCEFDIGDKVDTDEKRNYRSLMRIAERVLKENENAE